MRCLELLIKYVVTIREWINYPQCVLYSTYMSYFPQNDQQWTIAADQNTLGPAFMSDRSNALRKLRATCSVFDTQRVKVGAR